MESKLPRVQECHVLDPEIDFNPMVRQEIQRELGKVLAKRTSPGSIQEFERRYVIVEEEPVKEV